MVLQGNSDGRRVDYASTNINTKKLLESNY